MNFAFMELFAATTAQCHSNFNKLFVPFRCVTSDVYNKRKFVFRDGNLGEAIRASMSFPIVFKPVYMNGLPMFDGGIYDNFPVDVMRHDFAPGFMIGVDVSSGSSKPDVNSLVDQIETMIIQDHDVNFPDSSGIKMVINLQDFGLLDFDKAKAIYKIGYDYTLAHMDSIKTRIHSRVPQETRNLSRSVFKSMTPYVEFDSVHVEGAKNEMQNKYIEELFMRNARDTFDLEEAKISYYRAISSDKLKDLVPHAVFNDSTRRFSLNMDATVKGNYSVGVGGFLTSSTNSMIYLSCNYKTLSYNSFDASLRGWIGQSYYGGELFSKIALKTQVPSYAAISGVVSKQKFYESDMLFYSDELPTFIINYDNHLRLQYGFAIGRKAKMEFGIGYGHLEDRFYQSNVVDFNSTSQDHTTYKLGQIIGKFEHNTLNHPLYPTAGSKATITAIGVTGKYTFTPASLNQGIVNTENENMTWGQVEVNLDKYFPLGNKFVLGTKIDVLGSTKKLVDNYTANIVQAPAFNPTPATKNYFNPDFRSNSFLAAGIIPLFKIIDNLQFRTEFYAFVPFRKICESADYKVHYSKWFNHVSYMGEAALIYNFSFASLSIYGNYLSYPARNWNFGISFGLLFTAPRFLR